MPRCSGPCLRGNSAGLANERFNALLVSGNLCNAAWFRTWLSAVWRLAMTSCMTLPAVSGWCGMGDVLRLLGDRLRSSLAVASDMRSLARIPSVHGLRMKLLYAAGFTTIEQMARSDVAAIFTVLRKSRPFEHSPSAPPRYDTVFAVPCPNAWARLHPA
eukprot:Polyplicarium_translucidae@DN3286_c0_g1_i7.p1